MTEPHPFEEIPDNREGYRYFLFEIDRLPLYLITVEREGSRPYSLIGHQGTTPDWVEEEYHFSRLPFLLDVDGAVQIIRMRQRAFAGGIKRGAEQARFEIRKALGL